MSKRKYRVYAKIETSYIVEAESDWEAEEKFNEMLENNEANPILDTEHEPFEIRVDLEEDLN